MFQYLADAPNFEEFVSPLFPKASNGSWSGFRGDTAQGQGESLRSGVNAAP